MPSEPAPEPAPAAEPEQPSDDVRTLTAVADRPLTPRRASARRPPPPRRPVRRTPPPRQRRPRATGERRWGRRLIAVAAFVVLIVVVVLGVKTFQPGHGAGAGIVRVNVPAGANVSKIGSLLADKGVVDSAAFFQINATVTGRRGGLRPGDYKLAKGMSYGDAIAALQKGPKVKVIPTVNVTLPEGPSLKEEAPVVDRSGKVTGSYAKAARSPKVIKAIRRLGAPKGTTSPEGFLFPATYTLVRKSPAKDLVAKQLAAFKENFAKVDMSYARKKNLTRYDVLIIASMIEREAQLDRERPLVSAVIYNRLKADSPLGIDATIRYYTNNWERPIRVSELQADEPYNTRLRRGLPPTPIGNPGLASLKAAASPAKVDYFFYVRKPGNSGAHAFSSTNAQFLRDQQRYQDSRGGP
jgi:UPF0755 protein